MASIPCRMPRVAVCLLPPASLSSWCQCDALPQRQVIVIGFQHAFQAKPYALGRPLYAPAPTPDPDYVVPVSTALAKNTASASPPTLTSRFTWHSRAGRRQTTKWIVPLLITELKTVLLLKAERMQMQQWRQGLSAQRQRPALTFPPYQCWLHLLLPFRLQLLLLLLLLLLPRQQQRRRRRR